MDRSCAATPTRTPTRRAAPAAGVSRQPERRRRGGLESVAILALFLPACAPDWPAPPPTRIEVVTDTLHGVEIADPYRWLEDQESPETREWIAAQNAYAREIVSDADLETRLEARLRELMDQPAVSAVRAAGEHEIFTLRRTGELQARIMRRPKPEGEPTGERPDPEGGLRSAARRRRARL